MVEQNNCDRLLHVLWPIYDTEGMHSSHFEVNWAHL